MLNLASNLPRPNASQVDKLLKLLNSKLGPSKYLTAAESCEAYARDESEAIGVTPDAVVLAESRQDICTALSIAQEAGVALTPRGGGTGRAGGSTVVAGGIVLATAGMASIKEIDRDEQLVVVEPGLILGDLHRQVEAEGLFYPPDANSLTGCAIGGNVATNAGGPRAFKYGVTRNYVLGVEAMLMGGQSFFAGRRTRKGVTGYDVTSLLVGSEGTLAVLGDITLRVIPKPERVMTLLALFNDVGSAARTVDLCIQLGATPRCLELLDAGTLQAVRQAGNPIDERAGAMLLIEVDGDEHDCERDAMKVNDACEKHAALEVLVAQDASQRDRLWSARREMSYAVRRMAKNKLSEDVVVPRRAVPELLDRVRRSTEQRSIQSVTYGHAGDGNLHVNFLWDEPDSVPKVEACIDQLFRDVIELRGTLTGEHGVGVLKAPYLHYEQSQELIQLQQRLKGVFDPAGLLNPGKIFSNSHGPC